MECLAETRNAQDGVVDIAVALRESNIQDVLGELDGELIGLLPVKQSIRQIASLLLVERLREQVGLCAQPPSLHMCFTGRPGTGKTTVAMRMAKILHRLGLCAPRASGGGHSRRPGGTVRGPYCA